MRNYRPISKLSVIAKVLESVVTDVLFDEFKDRIIKEQHGFFKGRSIVTNLLSYTECMHGNIDEGLQTDVI